MTSQKTLSVISALALLYCVFLLVINILGVGINGIPSDPLPLLYLGITMLAAAVTFVASYRQLFKQWPKLVLIALGLVLISQCVGYFALLQAMNDPMTVEMNKAVLEGIQKGLEDGTLPKGQGFEEQLEGIDTSKITTLKEIGFYVLLFVLPIYTNFRKNSYSNK